MTAPLYTDSMTLAQARVVLQDHLQDGGDCPCCGQTASSYSRALTSVGGRLVIALWEHHGQDFAHVPTLAREYLSDIAGQAGYLLLGQHGGLIECQYADGERRRGWWRITPRGVRWLAGMERIPSHVELFDNRVKGFSGSLVGPRDVLGTHFDFDDLRRPMPSVAGLHALEQLDLLDTAEAA